MDSVINTSSEWNMALTFNNKLYITEHLYKMYSGTYRPNNFHYARFRHVIIEMCRLCRFGNLLLLLFIIINNNKHLLLIIIAIIIITV